MLSSVLTLVSSHLVLSHIASTPFTPPLIALTRPDVQGNVRIWDATLDTHILKLQTRPLSSRINDLCWDSESKRLIAVGDGKERYIPWQFQLCIDLLSLPLLLLFLLPLQRL